MLAAFAMCVTPDDCQTLERGEVSGVSPGHRTSVFVSSCLGIRSVSPLLAP